jgi:hypothetical protein
VNNLHCFVLKIAEERRMSEAGWNTVQFTHEDLTLEMSWYCDVDWEFYSKTYRRNGGIPKKTLSGLHLMATDGHRSIKYELESLRGNYLLEPLRKFFRIKPTRKVDAIQLNKSCRIVRLRTIGRSSIYLRTIGKIPYDYCLVNRNGVTFHGGTLKDLAQGLRNKLKVGDSNIKIYNFKIARELGFCETGTHDFMEFYQLNSKASYTKEDIRSRIIANPEFALRFPQEVMKLKLLTQEEEVVLKGLDPSQLDRESIVRMFGTRI